ncbi:MAG: hypothetical protein ABR535_01920 [Pyrinomonadaceae bacterium]
MKKTTFYLTICMLTLIALSSAAFGQSRNQYSRTDVDGFIRNLENSSDAFSRDFRSAGGTSNTEDRIVSNFENAVDRLRRRFDSGDNWWQSRNEVQAIMPSANQVDTLMRNDRYARRLERQWRDLRRDINRIADTYDLPGLQGGGWNGGGGGGWNPGNPGMPGPGGVRPPSWASGTFYGRNPYDGTRIILTIDNSGRVSADVGGSMSYGAYRRGNTLWINGATSRVTNFRNGISTIRTDNGERIDYYRTDSGWGGGGGNWGGNASAPPTWARGTFYGRSPADGSEITLTISNNGRVTAYIGGNMSYGSYYNGTINIDGAVANVTQNRNGIRTTRVDNGEVINYRR